MLGDLGQPGVCPVLSKHAGPSLLWNVPPNVCLPGPSLRVSRCLPQLPPRGAEGQTRSVPKPQWAPPCVPRKLSAVHEPQRPGSLCPCLVFNRTQQQVRCYQEISAPQVVALCLLGAVYNQDQANRKAVKFSLTGHHDAAGLRVHDTDAGAGLRVHGTNTGAPPGPGAAERRAQLLPTRAPPPDARSPARKAQDSGGRVAV